MQDASVSPNAVVVRCLGLSATAAISALGIALYLNSASHELHDPVHALQQFDAFYLDEAAPSLDELGVQRGDPTVVFFCDSACGVPIVEGIDIRRSSSAELASQYALVTDEGRVGPGYALIDSRGRLRYRTFDPGLHQAEIQVLADALS